VFGIAAFYRYPTTAVLFALVAAVSLAAAAGYLSGRAAGRLKVSEALGYE
jgi:ABC-type lipoprotein release transport system permease subunit